MKRITPKAAEYLQLLQVRIVTRSGADTVVHSVMRVVPKYGRNPEYGMLTMELKNAFNICSRYAFLKAVKILLPKLLPWM